MSLLCQLQRRRDSDNDHTVFLNIHLGGQTECCPSRRQQAVLLYFLRHGVEATLGLHHATQHVAVARLAQVAIQVLCDVQVCRTETEDTSVTIHDGREN